MAVRSDTKPLVSIAILTWNRIQALETALESIYTQPYRPIEIVVVDSASIDGTAEYIKRKYPEVRIIELHRNLGCPEGRNLAFANCSGEIIFSLDDDASIAAPAIDICVEHFRQDKRLAVVACQVAESHQTRHEGKGAYYTHIFSGGACAIRRSVLDIAGYFPADFFRQAEEGDLTLRIIDAGYRIIYEPKSTVYHSPTRENNSKETMFYACRNELYTVIRRYPYISIPLVFLWKAIIWNLAGFKNGELGSTFSACLIAVVRSPWLLSEREPVSFKTIYKVFSLKLFSRRVRNK
jgi:GT2 family glycosyltransferase